MRVIAIILIFLSLTGYSQNKIKNVIYMIPDGTSSDLITATRWYKGEKLALDEIICGMVSTHTADGKITDSAPAGTALATGVKSNLGFIGVDKDSLPHISLLEMAKLKGLSTGIAVTCEFPHATPASFVCHYPDRNNYEILANQFIYNSPDLFFGGGEAILDKYNLKKFLKDSLGYNFISDLNTFKTNISDKVWALFPDWKANKVAMSFDCDRNKTLEPSLAEMTSKAIDILSKNKKGFFLMVEGSQIDWAAHNNDPYAAINELIAFDAAVKIALDFAKKDKHTIVVVCPDHGNGGFTLGNQNSGKYSNKNKYDKIDINEQIVKPLKKIKCSSDKLAALLIKYPDSINTDFILKKYNISFTENEIQNIKNIINSGKTSYFKQDTINYIIGTEFSRQNFIGWTTTGHTGEDVFLGVYHPQSYLPSALYGRGIIDNTEVTRYISKNMGVEPDSFTKKYFKKLPVKTSFNNYKPFKTIDNQTRFFNNKNNIDIIIPANKNYYFFNGKKIFLKTLIVKIKDKYYIPFELYNALNK
ncbi:MAG: alkaline phosphatase [Bacteroidales bacterium]|nr:alkaline phosphatase [Bacteroidales bacterium]